MTSSEIALDRSGAQANPMTLATLIAPSAELRRALTEGKWQAQYCTTNYVTMSRRFVLKRYRSRTNFQVERAVCEQRARFPFEMSRLIDSVDDPHFGTWNIFERLPGRTLHEYPPPIDRIPGLLDAVVDALVYFEETAYGLSGIRFRKWSLSETLAPLISSCRDRDLRSAADTVSELAGEADKALRSAPRVPCFDLFLRNIIWRPVGAGFSVAHIDFDKADRLVCAGEQLSHLATSPRLRPYVDRAVKRYSMTRGMDQDLLAQTYEVSRFFRVFAGIRDSMPRIDGAETVSNAAVRRQSFLEFLHLSETTAPVLISRLGLSRAWLHRLRGALADLELLAST